MIVRHLIEGGTHMYLIYLMWIAVIILSTRVIVMYRQGANTQKIKRANNIILFIGSFAFLFGISGQMIGLSVAFEAMQQIENASIDPQLIAGGLRVSALAPLYGLVLLLLSSIVWFVFKNLNEARQE